MVMCVHTSSLLGLGKVELNISSHANVGRSLSKDVAECRFVTRNRLLLLPAIKIGVGFICIRVGTPTQKIVTKEPSSFREKHTLRENEENDVWPHRPQGPLNQRRSQNTHPCFFRKTVKFPAPLFGKEIRRMVMCVLSPLSLGVDGGERGTGGVEFFLSCKCSLLKAVAECRFVARNRLLLLRAM
ncbi:hypothetical protein CEXT_202641 [Caerostris extrusa]|uniref:Uncharacterized protein n=1 Tax=Caerostris extrusa TaxID=172846 RepID=A0AAV4RZI9_CAEEX|nr:hypothetical protein CEXT_202641 [Caerostris extrusa]